MAADGRSGRKWFVAFGVQFSLLMLPSAIVSLVFMTAEASGSTPEALPPIYGIAMVFAFLAGAWLVRQCRRLAIGRARTRVQLQTRRHRTRSETGAPLPPAPLHQK